jgi:pectin methylesterase-like acyl-CoA thioesterase
VAKDGSGTHVSIGDAVEAAPAHSTRRVVIYIKAGVYSENVKVARDKTNLMLVGAGAGQTVVVGRPTVGDGLRTFDTATLSVSGDGFMMRDLKTDLSAPHRPTGQLPTGFPNAKAGSFGGWPIG